MTGFSIDVTLLLVALAGFTAGYACQARRQRHQSTAP
jgi:hypothetical protein